METYEQHLKLEDIPEQMSCSRGQRGEDSSERRSGSWSGGYEFKKAVQCATLGDLDTLDRVNKRASEIKAKTAVTEKARVRKLAVAGGSIHMGKYLEGNPQCMRRKRGKAIKKRINLAVQIGAHCGIRSETMERRGLAIAAAVRALETQGYAVAVTVFNYSTHPDHIGLRSVEIKKSDQYVDPAVTAYWLAHTTAFRRIMFKLYENTPSNLRIGGNYGYTNTLPIDQRKERFGLDAVVLDSKSIDNSRDVVSYVEETSQAIQEQSGIELEF